MSIKKLIICALDPQEREQAPISLQPLQSPEKVGATCSSIKNRGRTRNLKSAAPIPRPSKRGRGQYFYIDRCPSVERQIGCCCDFFSGVVVRPHARPSEASTWHKKRVQTVMVKALLKKVRIMNRDAPRAAAAGSYLMIPMTMRK
jgi:hypothetical protein